MNERIVVGVDIGTTKVCAVVAAVDPLGSINILGVGVAESDGLNRGVVVNIDKTVAAVRAALEEAARDADVDIRSVIVGIAGDHVQSFRTSGVITISPRDREIVAQDVQRLIKDTTHVAMPADRQILHALPQEFIVDGQDGVADPVGMSGVRLEGTVHIITGLVSAAKNVFRCIEKAGYQIEDIVLEPLASSCSVLHRDEKEVGVALIDIGGGTTDIAVFEDNRIRHTAVIGIAGNNVTDDIRRGLGVMRDQAEQLKCRFGVALIDMASEEEEITIPGLGGRPEKSIGRSPLAQIIQPRMEEILEIAAIEIKRSGYMGNLAAGVVLTGGGSLIPGVDQLASDVLGMEARVGMPTGQDDLETRVGMSPGLAGGMVQEVSDPKFSTAVGLVFYGMQSGLGDGAISSGGLAYQGENRVPRDSLVNRIASRMKGWFDEL